MDMMAHPVDHVHPVEMNRGKYGAVTASRLFDVASSLVRADARSYLLLSLRDFQNVVRLARHTECNGYVAITLRVMSRAIFARSRRTTNSRIFSGRNPAILPSAYRCCYTESLSS